MTENSYRVAPAGFTPDQWEEFQENGILVLENVIPQEDVDRYVEAIDRVAASDPNYAPGKDFRQPHCVAADPVLSALIDHPRHVGYGYDLYGELLKLHRSDIFIRPRDYKDESMWHPDSPRPTPYAVFSTELPLRLCVGLWLTDLPHAGMGNFIYMPAVIETRNSTNTTLTRASPGKSPWWFRPEA